MYNSAPELEGGSIYLEREDFGIEETVVKQKSKFKVTKEDVKKKDTALSRSFRKCGFCMHTFCQPCRVSDPCNCFCFCGCCFHETLGGDYLRDAREGAFIVFSTVVAVCLSICFSSLVIAINVSSSLFDENDYPMIQSLSVLFITFGVSTLGVFFIYCSTDNKEKMESFYDLNRFQCTYVAKFCFFLVVACVILLIGCGTAFFSTYYSVYPLPFRNATGAIYIDPKVRDDCFTISIFYLGCGFFLFVSLITLCNRLLNPPPSVVNNLLIKIFFEHNEKFFTVMEMKRFLKKLYYYTVSRKKMHDYFVELVKKQFLFEKIISGEKKYKKIRTKDILIEIFHKNMRRNDLAAETIADEMGATRNYPVSTHYLKRKLNNLIDVGFIIKHDQLDDHKSTYKTNFLVPLFLREGKNQFSIFSLNRMFPKEKITVKKGFNKLLENGFLVNISYVKDKESGEITGLMEKSKYVDGIMKIVSESEIPLSLEAIKKKLKRSRIKEPMPHDYKLGCILVLLSFYNKIIKEKHVKRKFFLWEVRKTVYSTNKLDVDNKIEIEEEIEIEIKKDEEEAKKKKQEEWEKEKEKERKKEKKKEEKEEKKSLLDEEEKGEEETTPEAVTFSRKEIELIQVEIQK